MGSGQSTDDQDMSGETHGYHVMQVVPNSPASKAGLEIFFDYITHVNGLRLDREPIVLASQLRSNIGKPVNLVVYSSKTLGARNVTVVPEKNDYGILGCSVRFCDFGDVHDHIWHIIEVHANSPAEIAGLREKSDYIIGTPNTTLEEKDDFYNLVKKHANIPLQLYVYNSDSDSIREVLIVPNNDWDGEGLLGCDVGYGRLHRIAAENLHHTTDDHEHGHHEHEHHGHEHKHHNHHGHEHGHEHHDHQEHKHHDHQEHKHHDHQEHSSSKDSKPKHVDSNQHAEHDHSENHHEHDHADPCMHDVCDSHDHNMITDTSLKQDQQSQSHETAEEFDEKSITELHHLLQAVELQTYP
ncbi:hypothetical protein BDEG_20797 [Batrachochytrium dendrobatidis JEL423]|uniref:PDZ GRASP-type domain-containing protein n=1 Tax=Batrachochytrium dendrobatidis (strain JEL423) TaxID=403673 RepID=A0A177WAB9_BATDL|nr:hypothetical protein BDEG_20797 [Batrachochytrium dendrobatidis JEL423]